MALAQLVEDAPGVGRASQISGRSRISIAQLKASRGAAIRHESRKSPLRERCIAVLPGQYFDEETGLHYNYRRDYDAETGRYEESDIVGLRGGLNTYVCVGSNPLRWTDPSGMIPPHWWEENAPPTVPLTGPFGPVCGPEGSRLATFIPDGPFTEACRNHDKSYATCGKSKWQCDLDLYGHGIQAARQIGGKHLRVFARQRAVEGISARTRANELSHLRAVLVQVGKQGLARNPAYSNRALGIERGTRVGTKEPLSDEAIHAFQRRMAQLERPGVGVTLELQRALGLREAEAIRAGQADTLSRWQRELRARGSVRVVEGTKGGRPREVCPADVRRAQAALQRAQAALKATGHRYLVTPARKAPAAGLKQALGIYHNLCHRAGIQSHGARYAFARERLEAYRSQGYSEREARAATSQDLGHGDGRGRYIASVYVRGA